MGKQTNLFVFSDVTSLAPALRSYVIQCQNAGIARHGVFKVGVSGGSLPATLAKALLLPPGSSLPSPSAANGGRNGGDDVVRFDKWEIFFADERAVPLDHPDSNYGLLKTELLDKIPADAGQPVVHAIDTSQLDDTQELADQYEQALVASFASRDSVRLPIFDLLLLGCGPDGHTCSLFPGHELLRETSAWVAPIDDSPKPPPRRITLTLPVVTHSVRVAFVATGGGKKDIMKQIFDEDSGLPCALVNDGAGDRCSWFVDNAAVEGVSFPKRGFNL
ncbi:6-phosphogluconolactonase [Niveomyces insectorum RCEF 264]|uniref:6-phosphogluconolactonase n=1 Tax=Niveomyces insectorum RCEF 264 TaxID=1081102 RepID=A0A167RAD9_9HYPO|nr:6-phosphogluconolactonase [Niveomyces insectorum RCEF 264]